MARRLGCLIVEIRSAWDGVLLLLLIEVRDKGEENEKVE